LLQTAASNAGQREEQEIAGDVNTNKNILERSVFPKLITLEVFVKKKLAGIFLDFIDPLNLNVLSAEL